MTRQKYAAPSATPPWSRLLPPGGRGANPVSYFMPTLAALAALIEEEGHPPSLRELRDGAGLSSLSVVTYHLWRLGKAGLLEAIPDIARSLRITRDGWRELGKPAPGAPANALEVAVVEGLADLRAALAQPLLSKLVFIQITDRLEMALEMARSQ